MKENIIKLLLYLRILKIVPVYKYCECGIRLSEWFKAKEQPDNHFKIFEEKMRCYSCGNHSEHKSHDSKITLFLSPSN